MISYAEAAILEVGSVRAKEKGNVDMSIWGLYVALIWAVGPAQPTPHEKRSHDPWIPRSSIAPSGVLERCDPVVRDDAPQFASIQINVDHRGCNILGDAANEPSIAIDPTDSRRIVIGWRQFDSIESDFRQAGYAYSHDGGHTWVFPGSLTPGVFGSDPVLVANAEGVFYYLSINFDEMRLFRSGDGGVMWGNPIWTVPGFRDKPWMAVDRTNGIGRGNVYIEHSDSGLFRSTDGGNSFTDFSVGSLLLWPALAVDPFGVLFKTGHAPFVTRSINAQDPKQEPTFELGVQADLGGGARLGGDPNLGGLLGQIWIDTDWSDSPKAGNVYLFGSVDRSIERELDLAFSRSEDCGLTWSKKVRVNDDPEGNGAWQWFGTMSVAPNGRIDVIWNDTRNFLEAESGNLCELFYAYSKDGGRSWSKNIPVSPMFDSRVGWAGDELKIGDYYHMISDNLGANVVYAATFNGEQDIYFLRIGPWDCNGNEIPDVDDISQGTSLDCNANEVPDECEYRGDFDGDRVTTLVDIAALQHCFSSDNVSVADPCCLLLDLNEDDSVSLADLAALHRVFNGP